MVELSLMVAGSCRQFERMVRRGGRWRPIDFPSSVAVIRHPTRGVVLYDAGYTPEFFTQTARLPYSIHRWMTPVRCAPEDTAAAQLAGTGIDPAEVSLVIVSHFHADHIGGLRDFPNARFLYLRTALDRAWRERSALANVRRAFLPGHLPPGFEGRSDHVEDRPVVPVAGLGAPAGAGFDLLGDGSLIGLDLSGHVRGQLGLLVEHTQGPPVALVGDACWTGRAITDLEFPHPFTRLLTECPRTYRRQIHLLRDWSLDRPELLIVPSHCAQSLARARTALAGDQLGGDEGVAG